MQPMPAAELLLLRDAAAAPRLFHWNGPIESSELSAWCRQNQIEPPVDLLDAWAITGGGTMFETEDLWAPRADPLGEDIRSVNIGLHAHGLAPRFVAFHTGLWVSAIDRADGSLAVLVPQTFSVLQRWRTFDDWYGGAVRAEYAARYGLT